MQYEIAVADSLPDLQQEVQDLVDKGYVPQGGIAVVVHNWEEFDALYYQAMFKPQQ